MLGQAANLVMCCAVSGERFQPGSVSQDAPPPPVPSAESGKSKGSRSERVSIATALREITTQWQADLDVQPPLRAKIGFACKQPDSQNLAAWQVSNLSQSGLCLLHATYVVSQAVQTQRVVRVRRHWSANIVPCYTPAMRGREAGGTELDRDGCWSCRARLGRIIERSASRRCKSQGRCIGCSTSRRCKVPRYN